MIVKDKLVNKKQAIKILLIENNPQIVFEISQLFQKNDIVQIDLEHVSLLSSAIKILNNNDVDLILLDLSLEDSDGYDTFLHLHTKYSEIPIIILTSSEEEELALKALKSGALDYFKKGMFNSKLMVHIILYILEAHKLSVEMGNYLQKLQVSEFCFRKMIENNHDGMIVISKDKRILFINPSAERLMNVAAKEYIGKSFNHPILHNQAYELSFTRKKGKKIITQVRISNTRWEGKDVFLATLRDITELVTLREKLKEISLRDELSGLLNRRGFLEHSDQQFKIAKRSNQELCLLFVDIDQMKSINDSFGHNQGDLAIQATSQILKKTFRESDVIARIGGDEFVVLASKVQKNETGEILINRLNKSIDQFVMTSKLPFELSLSTGIVYFKAKTYNSVNEVLTKADQLMYEEKQKKKRKAV